MPGLNFFFNYKLCELIQRLCTNKLHKNPCTNPALH